MQELDSKIAKNEERIKTLTEKFKKLKAEDQKAIQDLKSKKSKDLRESINTLTQIVLKGFKRMDARFDIIEERLDHQENKLSRSNIILDLVTIKSNILEEKEHNRNHPFELKEVMNKEGKYPSEVGLPKIQNIVQLQDFENRGDVLNSFLEFYGFVEGSGKDYSKTGPIYQRKSLLAEALGIPEKWISKNQLQASIIEINI